MRFMLCTAVLLSLIASSFSFGQFAPDLSKKDDGRYQMLAIGGRAMLLERETGKSWLLSAKGDKAAWIPIQRLSDSTVASGWLKANLPSRSAASGSDSRNVSMSEAKRQVQLEQITNSEVAAEPFSVLVAREKAALSRLKSEYGDRHPEVLASRNRLLQLLKVGDKAKDK